MPMKKFFTLFSVDWKNDNQRAVSLLESSNWDELFESEQFLNLLDQLSMEPPSASLKMLKAFVRAYEVLPLCGGDSDELFLN